MESLYEFLGFPVGFLGFFSLDFLIHGANLIFLYIKKIFCLFKFAYLVSGKISLKVEPVISSKISNPGLSPQTFLKLTKLMLTDDLFLLSKGKIFLQEEGRGSVCGHLTIFLTAL